jgi:hypothetical protein
VKREGVEKEGLRLQSGCLRSSFSREKNKAANANKTKSRFISFFAPVCQTPPILDAYSSARAS